MIEVTIAVCAIFASFFLGRFIGLNQGMEQQQREDSSILHNVYIFGMSPSVKAAWRRVDGLTNAEEMREELEEIAENVKKYKEGK